MYHELQYNNIDKEASHKTCSNAEAVIHKRKHASAAALTILAQMSMDSKNPPSSWSIGVPVSLRQRTNHLTKNSCFGRAKKVFKKIQIRNRFDVLDDTIMAIDTFWLPSHEAIIKTLNNFYTFTLLIHKVILRNCRGL